MLSSSGRFNYFTMDSVTGQISTARQIDRENGDFNQGFLVLGLKVSIYAPAFVYLVTHILMS